MAASIPLLRRAPFSISQYNNCTHRCIYLTNHKLKSLELLLEWWEKCKISTSSSTVRRQCLQLALRSCKALMKRPMTNVQRWYTSWNCKMWEKMMVNISKTVISISWGAEGYPCPPTQIIGGAPGLTPKVYAYVFTLTNIN